MKLAPPRHSLLVALLLASGLCHAQGWNYPGWRDTPAVRVKAQALLQTLNAELLAGSSATRTLQQWCDEHRMANPARIRALRDSQTRKEADETVRRQLQAKPDERIGYRRVQLVCGERVLSEADNWYLPSRLTPEMNQALDHSDVPFGIAVRALNFRRQTEQVKLLWSPLPAGWEMKMPALPPTTGQLEIAPQVLQHRAVLYQAGNVPFSVVVETYQRDVFAFALDGEK
nr:hypothetical protein [Chromobacterium sp. ASV5]